MADKGTDETALSLKTVLSTDNCVMLYTSFGNGFGLSKTGYCKKCYTNHRR